MRTDRPLATRASDAPSPPRRPLRGADDGTAEISVLVVDDEQHVRSAVARMLRGSRYRVVAAEDAATALELMSQEAFDVVISDEQMPGMKGTEFLTIVAREYPGTPRILLTGHASVEVAKSAINDGAIFRFLEKPCDTENLRRAVSDALEQRANALAGSPSAESLAELDVLSAREREIADLLLRGPRITQVAKRLGISEYTVRNHLKSVFRKLNVHSQAELMERFGR